VTSTSHIHYLDTIRGLAALTVINEHYVIAYGLPCLAPQCQHWLDYSALHFWWDGNAAVSMFFVLSGLVLSLKYFRHGKQPDIEQLQLLPYILGRLFRIWLPYLAMLLVSGIVYSLIINRATPSTVLPDSEWIHGLWRNHPLTGLAMLREAFLLKTPEPLVLLPQAWTLSLELLLSLLLPAALLLLKRGMSWLVFFSAFMVLFLGVSVFLLHFLLGMLIACYQQPLAQHFQGHGKQWWALLALGFYCYTAGSHLFASLDGSIIWLSSGLGAGMLLLATLSSPAIQQRLSQPWLRHLGKISYSSYLLHMLILMVVTPYLLQVLEGITQQHQGLWLGGWLLTIALVQLLSTAFHHHIEQPCVSIGKRLLAGFSPR
jgi:peptidoglycan/LPS O-acetylase OafA/YrhL